VVTHDQGEAMAMSDRILLLNNGVIEQQGTPQEMYDDPKTLFTADFMGSNNRMPGKVTRMEGEKALLEGPGWQLWGRKRASTKSGDGTGMIRLERVRIAEGPGENRVDPELTTSMFLGDKWEHIFHLGETTLRAHSATALAKGKHWIELPREHFWVF
jgi:iron(III) transport system ATP-binding protein